MASMADCMDGIATLLTTSALTPNVYGWPADSVNVPCFVVGYPTRLEFDGTYLRGMDTWTFPVWHVVGKSNTKDARDKLSTAMNDTSSIKSALDGAQTFGDVRVTTARVTEVTVAGVAFLAAEYEVEVI